MRGDEPEIAKEVNQIRTKVYNGMSTSIASTENKVNYIDARNLQEHGEIKNDIRDLRGEVKSMSNSLLKKMDRLLWKLVGVTFFAIFSMIIIEILKVKL